MDSLIEKLEQVKQLGMYGVGLRYGGDVGDDDLYLQPNEREVFLTCWPTGVLGGCKLGFIGTVDELLQFDFKTKPVMVNNPPEKLDIIRKEKWAIWGTVDSVKKILTKPIMCDWNNNSG